MKNSSTRKRIRYGHYVRIKTPRLCGDNVTPLFEVGSICLALPPHPKSKDGMGWLVRHPFHPGLVAAFPASEIELVPDHEGTGRAPWDPQSGHGLK